MDYNEAFADAELWTEEDPQPLIMAAIDYLETSDDPIIAAALLGFAAGRAYQGSRASEGATVKFAIDANTASRLLEALLNE